VRLPDGRLHPKAIGGPGAKKDHILAWSGTEPKWRSANTFLDVWARNRFVLTSSGAQTLLLSHDPKATPLFVFLNGMYQDEGTDFLLDSVGLQVQTAMGATSGDIVDVRYIVAGPASWLDDMGAEIMADSPALYWPLGDAAGSWTTLDISGNGRDGRADGLHDTDYLSFGHGGLIAGSSATSMLISWNRITRDDEPWMDFGDFSLEVVLRTTDSGGGTIWARYDTGTGQNAFWLKVEDGTGKVVFYKGPSGATVLTSTAVITDDLVHHVAVTYDGTTLRLYIDGALDSSATMATLPSATTPLWLGGYYATGWGTDSNNDFAGYMQHAAVYTHALSAARIAAHFAATGL
jgi:hypothetical protein